METLGLAILVVLIFGVVLAAASQPLLWCLIAALLYFIGLIGPAVGCLLLGAVATAKTCLRDN